jgi:ferric-dicitrate binding protein FerR (iron transport regulator)
MTDFDKNKITLESLLADESFQNYVSKSNSKDVDLWEKWIEDNPDYKGITEQAELLLHKLAFRKEEITSDIIAEEWDQVLNKIDEDKRRITGNAIINIYRTWQKVAAILLIPVLLASGLVWISLNSKGEDQYCEIITQNASKNKVILPDSSVVYLNTGSKIRYSNNYNKRERKIILAGEGYFDVAKNPGKPFSVIINNNKVTALGTKFTVRGYENEDFTQVILMEGTVAFESSSVQGKTILAAGDKLKYLGTTNELLLSKPDIEIETAWIHNILTIDNDSFDTLIRKLENWYGVNITISGNGSSISSSYRLRIKTESLRETLDLINYIIPVSYEINGDEVIVTIK